jgi:Bacterial regulatory proteins, lacI family
VAAASEVSHSTAGFVLTNDPHQSISAPTRERVQQAARELGYVPHGVARALRDEGSSRVVVLEIDWELDEGNYAPSYIHGLDDELAAHDHALLVRHGPRTRESTEQVLHATAPRAVLRRAEPYRTGRHDLKDDSGWLAGWKDGRAAHVALQIGHLADRDHRRIRPSAAERAHPGHRRPRAAGLPVRRDARHGNP